MIDGLIGILTPGKRTVVLDQSGRSMHRIDVAVQDAVHHDDTRIILILSHLVFRHVVGTGNAVVEVVGMCGTDVRDVLTCLGPCSSIGRVGVYDAANLREGTVEHQMRGCVAGRVKVALHDFAGLEVDNDHVGGFHDVVFNARGFDDDEAFLTVDGRHVAPGKDHKVVFDKVQIGLEYFFFQFFQHNS